MLVSFTVTYLVALIRGLCGTIEIETQNVTSGICVGQEPVAEKQKAMSN